MYGCCENTREQRFNWQIVQIELVHLTLARCIFAGRMEYQGRRMELEYDEVRTTQPEQMPLYHTVVHNCECHSFHDVIFGLMRIVGMGMRDAELKAKEIDFFGRGIVATTTLEIAELYAGRLHNEVVSAKGTLLQTSIEPA